MDRALLAERSMTEENFNAADPKQVKKRTDKAKQRKEQQDKDLKELLELPAFRRYIWRHINETCGVMRDPFSPNGSILNLNVGMQSVGRVMWAEVDQVEAKLIPQIMVEFAEAQ